MRHAWALLTTLAWGLWFGGIVALFLFVSHLFITDRATAVVAAPKMFLAFERYQLIVAAVALIASAGWRLAVPRAAPTSLFAIFAVTAIGTVLSAVLIRPPMQRLREQGESSGPQFQRLHKVSERVYTAQAVLLLIGGIILPIPLTPKREPATASPTAPPA